MGVTTVNANNIDPRTLSMAEFAGLLAPAADNGIGAMDPRAFAARLPTIFDMPTA
jgi:hypothetical protein